MATSFINKFNESVSGLSDLFDNICEYHLENEDFSEYGIVFNLDGTLGYFQHDDKPQMNIIELCKKMKKKNFKIFIVTSCAAYSKVQTIQMLRKYNIDYTNIYFVPHENKCTSKYREKIRHDIEQNNSVSIILNIGDNDRDMTGGNQWELWCLPSSNDK